MKFRLFKKAKRKPQYWSYGTLTNGHVVVNLNDEKAPLCECYGPDGKRNAALIADALNKRGE